MIKKNDFIELDFIARTKNGDVFDTNIKEEIEKLKLDMKPRDLVICIGQNMILPAIDQFLEGKEPGNYTLELSPEKAFGVRRRDLIKVMPISVFKNSDTYPQPGMVFQFDNMLAKITSVSGGRVSVDFNNPIAGKEVVYELRIKKIVTNEKEKVESLMQAFLGVSIPFKLEGNKIIIEAEKKLEQFLNIFKPKFKEILNLDLELIEKKPEIKPVTEENQSETKL